MFVGKTLYFILVKKELLKVSSMFESSSQLPLSDIVAFPQIARADVNTPLIIKPAKRLRVRKPLPPRGGNWSTGLPGISLGKETQTDLCASTPQAFGRTTSFPLSYHTFKILAENRFNCLKHRRVIYNCASHPNKFDS